MDRVVEIDPLPGSQFLNDVFSVPELGLLVSDTHAGTLWLISDSETKVWASGADLGNPNGLAWNGSLILAQFRGLRTQGQLLPDQSLLVTDYGSGKVTLVRDNTATLIWTGSRGTADLGVTPDRSVAAIPNMESGTLTLLRLK